MKKQIRRRAIALLLFAAMACGFAVPAAAAPVPGRKLTPLEFETVDAGDFVPEHPAGKVDPQPEELPAPSENVRVSILLDGHSALDAGYDLDDVCSASAQAYRTGLQKRQAAVTQAIERAVGDELDVVWNLTLAANLISANVRYDRLDEISAVPGVKEVVIEHCYVPQTVEAAAPNMIPSSGMIHSDIAWADGLTGAGSRIAIIDTGIDPTHQSFSEAGYLHAMEENAAKVNMSLADYESSVGVMTLAELSEITAGTGPKLNAPVDAELAYLSGKVPFAYNYVDRNYTVDHTHDSQTAHGSHVAGIAAANRYIPDGAGDFDEAIDTVLCQGVAPDAQLLVMKVFGVKGGAYDSDYMSALEDAIVLGCDAVNLSLGSNNAGFTFSNSYQELMESLTGKGLVVTMSAGNSGGWYDQPYSDDAEPYLYIDDVNMDMVGSPASYTNAMAVASVDNRGTTGMPLKFGDLSVYYTDPASQYSIPPIAALAGAHEFVMLDSIAADKNGDSLLTAFGDALRGKVVLVSRGESSFVQKQSAAAAAGAIACIVVNNEDGVINMNMSDASAEIPCVSVTKDAGEQIKAAFPQSIMSDGVTKCWTGTMNVTNLASWEEVPGETVISSFSAWGPNGALELKPEITAPGGNIYSVDGARQGGVSYGSMSGTSMAAPQVAGMAALLAQQARETGICEAAGLSTRQYMNSVLMSTAVPLKEDGAYVPVLRQGAGLADIGAAVSAQSVLMMDGESTASAADGKIKAELGDDPERSGVYSWGFTIKNLSDQDKTYDLRTELFTQGRLTLDGEAYLDRQTTALDAVYTYTVNGSPFVPDALPEADVNGDLKTDGGDVQAILDWLAGAIGSIDESAADFDGNGSVTTYDAYLLLNSLDCADVTVPAGETVSVTVQAALTEAEKADLDENYPAGAYVEGFTFAEAGTDREGAREDVTHSIPVLGFYGNWSAPAMFDRITAEDAIYDTAEKQPYVTAAGKTTNGLKLKYSGDTNEYWALGNYYTNSDAPCPPECMAINDKTTLSGFSYTLIRNAAAVTAAVTDENGDILWIGSPKKAVNGAYYNSGDEKWKNTSPLSFTINRQIGRIAAGVTEGNRITVSLYAIPELYLRGTYTEEQLKALIQSGALGSGASLSYTFTLDNTAPRLEVTGDAAIGKLCMTMQDNQYLAYASVTDEIGVPVEGGEYHPDQSERNEELTWELALDPASAPNRLLITLVDYAGNRTTMKYEYSDQPAEVKNTLFGFLRTASANGIRDWVEIDPEAAAFDTEGSASGLTEFALSSVRVCAAEYTGRRVFFAADDGYIYTASVDSLSSALPVCRYTDTVDLVVDMAMSGGKMYVLGAEESAGLPVSSAVYLLELRTGELAKQYDLRCSTGEVIVHMAADDKGTFYGVNCTDNGFDNARLWKWTAEDHEPAAVGNALRWENAALDNNGCGGALAWDHGNGVLYWANARSSEAEVRQYLLTLDPATGAIRSGRAMYSTLNGLFVAGDEEETPYPAAEAADRVELSSTELNILSGQSAAVSAVVYPWTLENHEVIWRSSDEEVAVVADGVVTGTAPGEATITAEWAEDPSVRAECAVHVGSVPSTELTGLIFDADGAANWMDFGTAADAGEPVAVGAGQAYCAGTLVGDKIYAITKNGGTCYLDTVDADDFSVLDRFVLQQERAFSDAAAIPADEQETFHGKLLTSDAAGNKLYIIDPETRNSVGWDSESIYNDYQDDPIAGIAYAGKTTYRSSPALRYYMITESGMLWEFYLYGGKYLARVRLSETGISLRGLSRNEDYFASLCYDENGWLYLSAYTGGDTAQLYAIDAGHPERTALVREFGEGVWPVTCLYQYERVTALTVKMNRNSAALFLGDTLELTAKVKPKDYTGGVRWSSSNPAAASVDENGLVTALAVGETVITAVSEDVDDVGNPASAECRITVSDHISVDARVKAQVVRSGKPYDVTVNLMDLTTGNEVNASHSYTAGGVAGARDYGVEQYSGVSCFCYTDKNGKLHRYAVSQAPELLDAYDITNMPPIGLSKNLLIYPTGSMIVAFDAQNSEDLYPWETEQNFCGFTYIGNDYENLMYLGLTADGMLYYLDFHEIPVDSKGYRHALGSYCALGQIADLKPFADPKKVSMAYLPAQDGLVIADAAEMILYWVGGIHEEEKLGLVAEPLGRLNADYISCLHSELDEVTEVDVTISYGRPAGADAERMESSLMSQPIKSKNSVTNLRQFAALEADGSLNAIRTLSAEAKEDEDLLTVTITALDAEGSETAAHNGMLRVAYDAETLEFVGFASEAEFRACHAENGVVTFCYADRYRIPAGTPVAELRFRLRGSGSTELNVTHLEADDASFETEEQLRGGLYRYMALYDAEGRMLRYTVLEQPFDESMTEQLRQQYPDAAYLKLFSMTDDTKQARLDCVRIALG